MTQTLSHFGIGASGFGRLTVISDDGGRADRKVLCRCSCGTEKLVRLKDLRRGATQSCGCLNRERSRERRLKHGHTHAHGATPTYHSWANMLKRCTNPNDPKWPDYGGRGIAVCERWRDFAAFLADMGERPVGKTIDRIDVDSGYLPGNCRWATAKEQANNRRPRRGGYTRTKRAA